MPSPYDDLPPRAYWRAAVAERRTIAPSQVYLPKFPITKSTRIVTAGSCFAQHVGRTLRTHGFTLVDTEPLPQRLTQSVTAAQYGYGLYSARYSNIYTMRQLLQLYKEALAQTSLTRPFRRRPALPVWEKNGRFFDAQRPGVEPGGLPSEALVKKHRAHHLPRVLQAFHTADVVIFTFGLTEAWVHKASGTVYPTAPGTIAGDFDPNTFTFRNFDYDDILRDFLDFRRRLMARRRNVRFLVTVSPVPLTATASGDHVEVATSYSKSILRAVCGALKARFDNVDYFPSYEIITSQKAGGAFFDDNLRTVRAAGVQAAMSSFLTAHGHDGEQSVPQEKMTKSSLDAQCEEALLEGFSK